MARKPTPAEARLLAVYQDAEAAILAQVTRGTGLVLGSASIGDVDAARARAATQLRTAVASVLAGTGRKARAHVDAIMSAAYGLGTGEALAELGTIHGGSLYDPAVDRGAIDRLAAAVLDLLTPAHMTVLRTTQDRFRDITARVVPGMLVGADTRREATQRALWHYADQGVTGFRDRTGRNWTLSAYAEMAVRTASARATEDGKHNRLREAGVNLVIVQASNDRCPKCLPWAGKVLSLDGVGGARTVQVQHATRDGELVDVHIAGSVLDARAAGWNHPQCRCSSAAYLPGVTKIPQPAKANGQYEARQRQRSIERGIRHAKAREVAALDDPARGAARMGVRAWQGRMREHLKANPDLLRRSYREQLGTGNRPTDKTRGEGDRGVEVKGEARTPRDMTSVELDREMQAALGVEDFDRFETLASETDRRDEANVARKERDLAARAARDEQRAADIELLIDQGLDDEEAFARVTGTTVDAQRRTQAITELRAQGYRGKGFDDLSRTAWKDYAYGRYDDAEQATNGYMLNAAGRSAGFTEAALFTASEAQVRRYASPEMLEWFDQNGRPDLAEFRAQLVGDSQAAFRLRNQRGDFFT